jgi:hypothetical protein
LIILPDPFDLRKKALVDPIQNFWLSLGFERPNPNQETSKCLSIAQSMRLLTQTTNAFVKKKSCEKCMLFPLKNTKDKA